MEGYDNNRKLMCSSSVKYFKASYEIYMHGGSVEECKQAIAGEVFNSKDVKQDAFVAFQIKSSIRDLDVKIKDAHQNNGKKKYDSGFVLDSLLRAAYESDPVSLEEERKVQVEQLKSVIKKYNLFVSDLTDTNTLSMDMFKNFESSDQL
jgi:hypothetical protein